MSYDSMNPAYQPAPTRRKRRRGLEVIFILGFIACLIVGLAALGGLWYLRAQDAPPSPNSPMELLNPDKVLLALATRDLAGDDTSALIRQALQAGEIDTAVALLLYDTASTGSTRTALWEQVARQWRATGSAEDLGKSLVASNQALNSAILDLNLHSLERSQSLAQTAAGLTEAAQRDSSVQKSALDAATQAKRAIAQLPDLLPAQRSQLLQPLKTTIAQLDAPQLAAEVDDLLRNPFLTPAGIALKSTWSTLYTNPAPDAAVETAVANRELAARNLADRDALTGGIDIEPEIDSLRNALLAEDAARTAWYLGAIDTGATQQAQLGVLLQQRDWLLRKLAIANRAYGLALMPEWENGKEAIEGELNGLQIRIGEIVGFIADAQPTALDQNLLRAEAALQSALQSSMGRFPGADDSAISQSMRQAQDALLAAETPPALPTLYDSTASPPGFRIQ